MAATIWWMAFALAALLESALLPRVEDPWPERIGLGFPFAMAGAGGVLAGVAHTESSPASRDRAVRRGGLFGFGFGAALYLLSLVVQLGSGL